MYALASLRGPLVSAAFAWQAWDNVHCQGVGCTPWRPSGVPPCALELVHPASFRLDASLLHNSGMLQVIHSEADKVWVDSCNGIEPGHEVWQKKITARLDLFQAFEAQWSELWTRHAAVAPSQRQDMVDQVPTAPHPAPGSELFCADHDAVCST